MLSKNIRKFRRGLDLTQEALGVYLGVTQRTIASYEHGTRKPPIDTLTKLSDVFGVTIDDLIRDTPTAKNSA